MHSCVLMQISVQKICSEFLSKCNRREGIIFADTDTPVELDLATAVFRYNNLNFDTDFTMIQWGNFADLEHVLNVSFMPITLS